ncbi:MAG: ABC transporter permease, partial [Actinomycetota bacterium]
MNPIVVLVVALLAVPLHDIVRRPGFRRLALRNAVRRPSETALVVLGAMLGTAIITAAFVVSDTLDASIRDIARTHHGPVDESVELEDAQHVDAAMAAVTVPPPPRTDGVVRLTRANATAATADDGNPRRAEPDAEVAEVDFDAARRFGADPGITGFADAGATPAQGEAVIGEDLADELQVEAGDTIELFAYGTTRRVAVRGSVPRLGLAGWPSSSGAESQVVFVAPGTIAAMAAEGKAPAASPPVNQILVSNEGGVFDSTVHSAAVKSELERRVEGIPGVSVQEPKQDVIDAAEDQSASVRQLYTGIGQFSVVAGI